MSKKVLDKLYEFLWFDRVNFHDCAAKGTLCKENQLHTQVKHMGHMLYKYLFYNDCFVTLPCQMQCCPGPIDASSNNNDIQHFATFATVQNPKLLFNVCVLDKP